MHNFLFYILVFYNYLFNSNLIVQNIERNAFSESRFCFFLKSLTYVIFIKGNDHKVLVEREYKKKVDGIFQGILK